MFFYLHYILLTSGLSGTSVLLAVYFKTYSDASQGETGALLMAIPFVSLFIKPIFCSMADRRQAHHLSMMLALIVMMLGFAPFLVIPFFPAFFKGYPRHSWYLQVVACLIGSSGLGVAWSLGDCLAVNHAQRTGVPFGRMRLMGTLSWGIYGFIIGQINEHPSLPKYMPAFIILHLSVAIELLLLAFWDRRCFEMVDPLSNQNLSLVMDEKPQQQQQQQQLVQGQQLNSNNNYNNNNNNGVVSFISMAHENNDQLDGEPESIRPRNKQIDNLVDSVPSSLGGTLKINPKTVKALFEAFSANDEELIGRLSVVERQRASESHNQDDQDSTATNNNNNNNNRNNNDFIGLAETKQAHQLVAAAAKQSTDSKTEHLEGGFGADANSPTRKNPQLVLLKMILIEDGRVLKYMILFTAFGAFVAPINFFFVSIESLCHERGYNFSQLAGAVLMSQALIETVAFLVVPTLLNHMTRWSLLSFGLVIMSMKYVFYAGWYYNSDVSPYWAVLAEWSHGIPYGIFCTIMADVSLMFANQSRLFIPELRRLGYLASETGGSSTSRDTIEAEERSIKMALRATMQALFSGFMDGLGQGGGALLCGLISDLYSYHIVWQIFASLTMAVFVLHLLIEATGSRWSDAYKPTKGTKAYEIMELSRAATEAQRKRSVEAKQAKLDRKSSALVTRVGESGAAPPM